VSPRVAKTTPIATHELRDPVCYVCSQSEQSRPRRTASKPGAPTAKVGHSVLGFALQRDAFTTDSPNYLFAGTSDAAASKARAARARFSRRCCARAQQVFRLMILLPQRPQPAMTSRRRGRRSESRCLAVAGRRRGCAIAETPFRRESAVPTPSRGAKVSRRPKFRSQSRSWCRGGRGHRFENRKIATREFSVSKNFGTLT